MLPRQSLVNRAPARNRSLFVALLAILFWAPLPHGGERFWEAGPAIVASFLLLAAWSFKQTIHPQPLPPAVRKLRPVLLLLVLWLLYVLFQAMPLPATLLEATSPHARELKSLALFGGAAPATSLSIDPGSSLVEFLKYASYLSLFFMTLVLVESRKRLQILAWTLFATGALLSFYSLVNHYTDGALAINRPVPPWGNPWHRAGSGTYSNYNHFAGFLELVIPVAIGLLFGHFHQEAGEYGLRNRFTRIIDTLFSPLMLHLLFIAIMFNALLITTSRGGNGAFLISLSFVSLVLLAAMLIQKRRLNRKALYLVPTVLISVMLLSSATLLTNRLEKQGLQHNGRSLMWDSARTIISLYPVTGSGAGTYAALQESYKNPSLGTNAMWKHAHSDFLELLADQGLIGFILLGSALITGYFSILSGIFRRRDPLLRGLSFGASVGTLSLLIHSLAEFNFHIPANALYFWVLMAMGLVASRGHQETDENNASN